MTNRIPYRRVLAVLVEAGEPVTLEGIARRLESPVDVVRQRVRRLQVLEWVEQIGGACYYPTARGRELVTRPPEPGSADRPLEPASLSVRIVVALERDLNPQDAERLAATVGENVEAVGEAIRRLARAGLVVVDTGGTWRLTGDEAELKRLARAPHTKRRRGHFIRRVLSALTDYPAGADATSVAAGVGRRVEQTYITLRELADRGLVIREGRRYRLRAEPSPPRRRLPPMIVAPSEGPPLPVVYQGSSFDVWWRGSMKHHLLGVGAVASSLDPRQDAW